ncbi:MAG: phosphoserine transaminase [Alphaproteobacteria bacterium]|nr:phosphoserine transaminase [Alphaproteobacteria bacterium]
MMPIIPKPKQKPLCPFFSSGPTSKRPGWTIDVLKNAALGRSHRSISAKAKINEVLQKTRQLLQIPDDYLIALTPASDTGAFETCLWSLLGPKPVDILVWDVFGQVWQVDITTQLKLPDVGIIEGPKGYLPDFKQTNSNHDIVFCWNGTTSGLIVPDSNWIAENREGLTLCDITSAVFAVDIPWHKLDASSFSWQKCMGGEAQHGILVLSPKAQKRLESYTPLWPMPRLFRLTQNGKINRKIFEGDTINTPSLLVIEDAIDALNWMVSIGGLEATKKRSATSLDIISNWVKDKNWIAFNAQKIESRSPTSICLNIIDKKFLAFSREEQFSKIASIAQLLEDENVAFDIKGHAFGDPCIRLWGGPTIDPSNMALLLPWIEWAFASVFEIQH